MEDKKADAGPLADARREVEQARKGVSSELDNLGASARAAVDIPAKVRRNPVATVGAASGAAFLLLGGPRRVAKKVEKSFFPKRYSRPPKVLPKDIEASLDRLPEEQQAAVRAHLERDFAAYLKDEHAKDPPNARTAAWKTYDLLLGIVGAAAARELVKALFDTPRGAAKETAAAETLAAEEKADMRQKGRR
jgi:hypothetical protein